MDKTEASVGERIITSSLWMGSWRWSARLIGFASVVILARLLVPEDFGIVATGMVIITFFDILIELGTDRYLIRLSNPEREDYDSAWSLRLLVISCASTAIFFLAEPAAHFYDDQRLADVLRVLALANLLRGFTNIGLTIYQRELQYRKIAVIGISQRLIGTLVTIALAFWLKSYWAMVIGEIALRLAELLLSYRLHPYRPRLATSRWARQWRFCRWIMVTNIARFMQRQGDNMVVAKFYGIELMGLYSMAMRFAALPTRELINPILSPSYSGLATRQESVENFNNGTLTITSMTLLFLLPAATLFASLAEPLVLTILGEKWEAAIPLIAPLTLAISAMMLNNPSSVALTVRGHVRLLAILNWISAISIVSAMVIVAMSGTLQELAYTRAGVAALISFAYFSCLCSKLAISVTSLLGAIYRPCLAATGMALVVSIITQTAWGNLLVISLSVLLGGVTYLLLIYALWRIRATPTAAEAVLFNKLVKLISRALHRRQPSRTPNKHEP